MASLTSRYCYATFDDKRKDWGVRNRTVWDIILV